MADVTKPFALTLPHYRMSVLTVKLKMLPDAWSMVLFGSFGKGSDDGVN